MYCMTLWAHPSGRGIYQGYKSAFLDLKDTVIVGHHFLSLMLSIDFLQCLLAVRHAVRISHPHIEIGDVSPTEYASSRDVEPCPIRQVRSGCQLSVF